MKFPFFIFSSGPATLFTRCEQPPQGFGCLVFLCKSPSPTPRHCGAISHIVYIKDNADIVNPRDGKIIIRFENFQT